mmetsp:Transcript_1074/g.4527  ORF Transcript_1074/g.4527 Transcript_1074/m.4527 type:complete len:100 (-) Transcript_1074:1721-2020(-)
MYSFRCRAHPASRGRLAHAPASAGALALPRISRRASHESEEDERGSAREGFSSLKKEKKHLVSSTNVRSFASPAARGGRSLGSTESSSDSRNRTLSMNI